MLCSKGLVELRERGFSSCASRADSTCVLGRKKQERFSAQAPHLLSTADRSLLSASGGSSYHALWVRNPYAAEELVGAEHLLVSGNKIPFDQELKKQSQINLLLLQCLH